MPKLSSITCKNIIEYDYGYEIASAVEAPADADADASAGGVVVPVIVVLRTLASGARQLVVHEALDTT
jgi:hypothetical protein